MLRVEGSFASALGSRPYVEELGSQQSWNRNISAPGWGVTARALEGQLAEVGLGESQGAWGPGICCLCDLGQVIQPPRVTRSSPAKWLTISILTSRPVSLLGNSVCPLEQPSQHQGLTVKTVLHLDRSSPITLAPTLPQMPTS